jgi:hypothetical protein
MVHRREVLAGGAALVGSTWLPFPAWASLLADPSRDRMSYTILRKGSPIGRHEIRFFESGDGVTVATEVAIDVKLMFVTAFRYRHNCEATWRDGRMLSLASRTDDDGRRFAIEGRQQDGVMQVVGTEGRVTAPAEILTANDFWSRTILQQAQVINVKHGRLVGASVTPHGPASTPWGDQGERYTVVMPRETIDLWYDERDECVGLVVQARGEVLDFRLEA